MIKESKEKEKPKVIVKKYYDVKIDTMLPAVLTYRVLAETPEEALLLIKHQSPTGIKHKLAGRKDKKATVYDMGSSLIRFIKNLL